MSDSSSSVPAAKECSIVPEGVTIIPVKLIRSTEYTNDEKIVFCVLLSYLTQGQSLPSHAKIAIESGLSEQELSGVLGSLKDRGAIQLSILEEGVA